MTLSAEDWPRTSTLVDALAAGIRKLPRGRGTLGLRLLPPLARLLGVKHVTTQVAHHRLVVELDDHLSLWIAVNAYELDTLRLIRRILRPGDAMVDAGGHIGVIACHAADCVGPTGSIVALEPDPRLAGRLRAHLESAPEDVRPLVRVLRKAASDRVTTLRMALAAIPGQSSVAWHGHSVQDVEVETVVLDDVLADVSQVRLLKVDVEGHEVSLLRGLQRTLELGKIDYIIIERNHWMLERGGYSGEHIHALVARHGYLVMTDDGKPVSRDFLKVGDVENLVYARNGALLAELAGSNSIPQPQFSLPSWQRAVGEAMSTSYPGARMAELKMLASQGMFFEAVAGAGELLAAHPTLMDFRGHYVFWLLELGQRKAAHEQLKILAMVDPENVAVQRLLLETAPD